MKRSLLIIVLVSVCANSCRSQPIDFNTAMYAKQIPFPSGNDQKWAAIKELSNHKDDEVCDSLFKIYNSIDTSIRGFTEYYGVIFSSLVSINTEKSAETIANIYTTNQPKFILQGSLINLNILKYNEKLFPAILNNLKPNLMNAHFILDMLRKNIQQGKITNGQLTSCLPLLENFYEYTKQQRDIPAPADGLVLSIYYWIANPILANCLHPIATNPRVSKILHDLFNFSSSATNQKEKTCSWEAYKALDLVDDTKDYLSNICRDIVYREAAYKYLLQHNALQNFPAAFNNQASLSEMIAVSVRNLQLHDTDVPANVTYAGTTAINAENYYFYQICWRSDCKKNSLVVVGPQPNDKSKFDINPKLKGKTVADDIATIDIGAAIKNYTLE